MIEKKKIADRDDTFDVFDGHLGGFRSGPMGDPDTYDSAVWDFLYKTYKPKSVIDVGCGEGHALNYFKSIGVEKILGIDGSRAVYDSSPIPENILVVDFYKGGFVPSDVYDLAWSCEFVEHVDEEFIQNYFYIFLQSKYVAMTHAGEDQGGHHHVNCKNEEYWIDMFKNNDFIYLEKETHELRNIATAKYVKSNIKLFKNINRDIQ